MLSSTWFQIIVCKLGQEVFILYGWGNQFLKIIKDLLKSYRKGSEQAEVKPKISDSTPAACAVPQPLLSASETCSRKQGWWDSGPLLGPIMSHKEVTLLKDSQGVGQRERKPRRKRRTQQRPCDPSPVSPPPKNQKGALPTAPSFLLPFISYVP